MSREEAIGQASTGVDWVLPQHRSLLVRFLRERGAIADVELTTHAKDGREINYLYHGELIQIEGRDCLLSIGVEVTDRKQHQREQEAILSIFRLTNVPNHVGELIRTIICFL